jgi:hypothetical protein
MDHPKTESQVPGDVSPITPFSKFCLNSLQPLTNFSIQAESAQLAYKSDSSSEDSTSPCGCSRTKCLKLYCECFSSNKFCQNCHCKNCKNKPEYEELRNKAKLNTIERNPAAFRPEISTTYKACYCKRSGCKKKYCECYEENRTCTTSCKCVGCKNLPCT